MSSALILMDYQETICRPDGAIGGASGSGPEASRRDVLAVAGRCLAVAREHGLTVAHVRVGFDEHSTLRTNRTETFAGAIPVLQIDDPNSAICHEVAPLPEEPVIIKQWVDPFVGSPLNGLLRGQGVDRLFLGGVNTNHVVESSARHAADLGYEVFVVEPMCSSFTPEAHEASIAALPVFADPIDEEKFKQLAASGS